jgi:Cu-Zn family superoxide dismutase
MRRSERKNTSPARRIAMKRLLTLAIPALVSLAITAGCESAAKQDAGAGGDGKTAVANVTPAKAASTQPSWGSPSGTVTFTQSGANKVKVAYDLKGLTPGKHGFHVHEKGDLSAPDLSSAGPHFNPTKHKHSGTEGDERHAGDLGNVEANKSGEAKGSVTVEGLSIGTGAADDVVGKSIIVHEKADDLKTDPSGNSGGRIGGGVIELKQ